MADRLQSYRNLVEDRQAAWESVVGIPYLMAYDLAYKSYQETLTAQKDADKERGELFVTAASVVIGSTLLGTVASVSMQKIIRRSIVDYARRNVDLTMLRLLNSTRRNKSVAFAVGKIFDEVKGGVVKELQDIATRWSQANIDFATATPVSQLLQVRQILINNRLCAFESADKIEGDPTMSAADKDAAFASLRRAPLAQRPQPRPADGKGTLAEKIELSFYLAAVLDSDSLVSWPASSPSPYGGTIETGKTSNRPIPQMPNARTTPSRPS